jgi:broad specificity phosphatase PhoE
LQRAKRTAEAVAKAHGLAVVTDDGLIEMDVGELEGLTFAELRERVPDLREKWGGPEGHLYLMPGSSEHLADVQARAVATVEGLWQRHREETVVVVSHNFVILGLIAWALGIELANFRRLRHGVAAVTTMDVRTDHARILVLNDGCHVE